MNLSFFKSTSPKPNGDREYLFALEIGHTQAKSAVWSVINDKPQVLAVGGTVTWDGQSEDSLLAACDQTLSDSASRVDESGKIQPEKVILGLPSTWIQAEKITTPWLKVLKTLSDKLSLKAVGFVITADAVIRAIQNSEGVPPTAIIIGVFQGDLEILLARMGKNAGTQVVKRSSTITSDVTEGLSRFINIDMLPSRMLLYDSGTELDQIRQTLLAHPWQAPQVKLPFLHFPKVENLPADFSIRSIALTGGFEVAESIGLIDASQPDDLAPTPTP